MPDGEVVVTTLVPVPEEAAFVAFTEQIDRWWDRRDLPSRDAVVRFEADRLVLMTPSGSQTLASVQEWSPPSRLRLAWTGPHSRPGDEVVVEFAAEAGGTRVQVWHRREGLDPSSVSYSVVGLWWAELLSKLIARSVWVG